MKKYILLAAVSISLAACNTEDNYIDQPIAVQVRATIGGSDLSRAGDNTWNADDEIGISMSGRYSNMQYTTKDGDGIFTGDVMYFRNKHESVTISAYYPYAGTEGEPPAVIEASTGIERQTEAEQPKFDFLYAVKENATGADPNINLAFSHRMSKITLIFKNGNKGTEVKKITSCRIDGLILEGTFNPVNGDCAAKTIAPAPLNLTPTVQHNVPLPSIILFPQNVDKVTVSITDSDNQEYSCELKFDDNRLEPGNNYLYTINVNKTQLNVEYAIINWTEKEVESDAQSE